MAKQIAILPLVALAAVVARSAWRHFCVTPLTNTELTKFLLPPVGPKRLKEGCSGLHAGIAGPDSDPYSTTQVSVRGRQLVSQDEIAVYRAVLGDAIERGWKHLNVSANTEPLSARALEACDCFNDFDLEDLPAAFHTSHNLTDLVLPAKGMRLVDPKQQSSAVHANDPSQTIRDGKPIKDVVRAAFSNGLFSMSEVAFDKRHRHAVVSYSFRCGMLCGNGATVILDRAGDQWKKSKRDCGGWIS